MKTHRFTVLATTVGLWLTSTLPGVALAQEPPHPLTFQTGSASGATPISVNQQLANNVAATLRQSGQLRFYSVDVAVQHGVVELTGTVADQSQRDEVLRIAQGVVGVERVQDRLVIHPMQATPATMNMQFIVPEPKALPQEQPGIAPPMTGSSMPPAPLPIFSAPPGMGGPGAGMPPPPMPPNAWPTYAPYNNYSRVAYPELYPHSAFPFIGPMNPFPKVPLGWRSIQLKWQDGHWWYGRAATGHDWWRVRYW